MWMEEKRNGLTAFLPPTHSQRKERKMKRKNGKNTSWHIWRITMIVIHRLKKLVCQELFLIYFKSSLYAHYAHHYYGNTYSIVS